MNIIRNNISFRIESSALMAKFKNHEYFILTEILNGKYEFSRTSKEIILLKFRLWTSWLDEIENAISFSEKETMTKEDVQNILYTALSIDRKYTSSLMSNSEVFDPVKTQCWLSVHKKTGFKYLVDSINSIHESTKIEAFTIIVDGLIEAMLMAMYELWEIKMVTSPEKKNKLAYTNINKQSYINGDSNCYLFERAKVYNEVYGATEFILENYTSGLDFPGHKMVNLFESAGLTINIPDYGACLLDDNSCVLCNGEEHA